MIPLAKPEMGDEEIALVAETIRSGWITQGPRVAEFERALRQKVGSREGDCDVKLHHGAPPGAAWRQESDGMTRCSSLLTAS